MKKIGLIILVILILQLVPFATGCGIPQAAFQADTTSGAAPLKVVFTNMTQKIGPDSKIVFDWYYGDGGKQTATKVTDAISHEYTKAGTYTVTLTEYSSDAPEKTSIITQIITVNHGVLSKIKINPDIIELKIGGTQVFTSAAFDVYDNPILEAKLTWSDGNAGTVTTDGSFTAGHTAGIFEKGVLGKGDISGSTAEGYPKITILPDPIDSAVLETLEIAAGESKQLVAFAKDKYGNKVAGLETTWSIANAKAGTITAGGLFTAAKRASTYDNAIKVTVKQGDKTAEAIGKVVVKAGMLSQAAIAPDKVNLGKGMTQQFVAAGADKYGNRITGISWTWSCTISAGSITKDGLFTAGINAYNFKDAITVTADNAGAITSKVSVNVESDTILYFSSKDDTENTHVSTYTMDTDGGNIKRLTLDAAGSIQDGIKSSSDGRRLLYSDVVRYTNGTNDDYIRISTTDGKWISTISSKIKAFEPSLSPDGTKIAYQSWAETDAEICVMDIDGGNVVKLTNNTSYDDYPSWSPDGKKIVYVSDQGATLGTPKIYVMNADGSNPQMLTRDTNYDSKPQWSPDGKQILFEAGNLATGKFYISVINADGSNRRNLTSLTADAQWPSWSPDGSKIIFGSTMNDAKYEIYIMNADGTNVIRVTNNTNYDVSPTWLDPKTGVQVSASSVVLKEDFSEKAMTALEISNAVKNSVVRIQCDYKNGSSYGTGFVIKSSGLILTNNHVISNVETITKMTVYMPNGNKYTGRVLSRDMVHDLALVKVDATDLPVIEIGSLSGIDAGTQVVVLGYPLGNETVSVTSGLVSNISYDDGINTTWIQTDSAINPGNSGGPVLDMQGRVIGVVDKKVFGIGVEGMGYAISADTVHLYLTALLEKAGITF